MSPHITHHNVQFTTIPTQIVDTLCCHTNSHQDHITPFLSHPNPLSHIPCHHRHSLPRSYTHKPLTPSTTKIPTSDHHTPHSLRPYLPVQHTPQTPSSQVHAQQTSHFPNCTPKPRSHTLLPRSFTPGHYIPLIPLFINPCQHIPHSPPRS